MNAFAVLQDDVEDPADLTAADVEEKVDETPKQEKPAAPAPRVTDSKASGSVSRGGSARGGRGGRGVRGREHSRGRGGGVGGRNFRNDDHAQKTGERNADFESAAVNGSADADADAADAGAADEDTQEGEQKQDEQPEEKDMTFQEYLAKKAELAASLAPLSSKGTRKANEGRPGTGFEKMSVLRKDDMGEKSSSADASSILSSVAIKAPPTTKNQKDSTHSAVMDNAKIQSFFNKSDSSAFRGPGGSGGHFRANQGGYRGRGGSGDVRRGNSSGQHGQQRDYRENRGYSNRDGREGGGRGGREGGYSRRGGYGPNGPRSRQPPPGSSAPDVDDQNAFPSLA